MLYLKYIKRIFDVLFSLILMILVLPVLLFAGVGIMVIDKNKVIFKQKRIGKGCKPFSIYKLSTMKKDKRGENKITKFGNILRITSIDELPQLLNILKGEMSFIGPRPWISEYTKFFTEEDKRRSEVLPGLSGWAQVQGRNDATIIEKLDADRWYVDNVSFKVDLIILLKTIGIVFNKKGASLTESGVQDELKDLKQNYYNSLMDANISKDTLKEEVG